MVINNLAYNDFDGRCSSSRRFPLVRLVKEKLKEGRRLQRSWIWLISTKFFFNVFQGEPCTTTEIFMDIHDKNQMSAIQDILSWFN